jgi:outer membrane protein
MRYRFPRHPFSNLAAAALLGLGLPGLASAQSLQELYDAARLYDATYLGARAQAQSAEFRAAQADALGRPTAALAANATTSVIDVPKIGTGDSNTIGATLSGRYPLFNRANKAVMEQARKALESAQADLETAEQDLVLRLTQAYFDVLAAQDVLATTRASKAASVSLAGMPRSSKSMPSIP